MFVVTIQPSGEFTKSDKEIAATIGIIATACEVILPRPEDVWGGTLTFKKLW